MHTLGRHLIAEYYGCDSAVIDDVDRVREALLEAARVVRATVVGETFHHYSPQGVSGTVVIAESHLSVHTWPERGYVAVDIYTCGGLDPRPGYDTIAAALGAERGRFQEILRGLPEDVDAQQTSCAEPLCPEDVQVIARTSEVRAFPTHPGQCAEVSWAGVRTRRDAGTR